MTEELFYITISVASLAVIAAAVFGIVLSSLVYSYHRAKLGKPDPTPSVDTETLDELARLRGRVTTLERLVTDDDRRLFGEIEGLKRAGGDLHAGA